MKRIAVTGATGFIGLRTVRTLAEKGYDVTALGRSVSVGKFLETEGVRFVRCELSDTERMKQAFRGHDCIVHCAALTRAGASADEYRVSNTLGTRNVMEAMSRSGARRWIHLSTSELYSTATTVERMGIRESNPLIGREEDPYLESKRHNEIDIDNYAIVPAIILRPQLVFGPGDRRLLPFVKRFARWGKLPCFDLGESMIDPVYVDNLVAAIIASIEADEDKLGKPYNITNGEPVENYNFLRALAERHGGSVSPMNFQRDRALQVSALFETLYRTIAPGKEPPLPKRYIRLFTESQTLNIGAARSELGYQPKIMLREAFRQIR